MFAMLDRSSVGQRVWEGERVEIQKEHAAHAGSRAQPRERGL